MSGTYPRSMLGLISAEPPEDAEAQARRADLVPSGYGETFGAAIAEGFASSPGPLALDLLLQGYRHTGDGNYAPLGGKGPLGLGLPPSPDVPLEILKRDYELPNLTFDKDTPQVVAQALYERRLAQLRAADAQQRATSTIFQGMAARFLGGMIGSLGDPVNIAAAFVPGLRETTAARILGVGAGASAGARMGVRALAGASAGAAGQLALEPANYWLQQQARNDWTMTDALANLAFGTILGGGIHTGLGSLRERTAGLPEWAPARAVSERVQAAEPEVQAALIKNAIAAQVEGRPNNAAALLELAESLSATNEIRRLAAAQRRLDADFNADAAATGALRREAGGAGVEQARGAVAAREGDLAALRAERQGLEADIAATRERTLAAALDPDSALRLEAVDTELAGVIPAARRRTLQAERTMLLEGRAGVDRAEGLESGRTDAEALGLQIAAERTDLRIAQIEERLDAARTRAETTEGRARDLARSAERAEQVALARAEARQAAVDDNAARAVRRLAAQLGERIAPGDAAQLGRALVRGEIDLQQAVVAIRTWGGDFARISPETLSGRPGIERLLADAEAQVQGVTDRALADLNARPAPAEGPPPRAGAVDDTPPQPVDMTADTLAMRAIEKDIATIDASTAAWDRQIAASGDEAATPGLKEFDALADEAAKADAAAFEAAAICLTTGRA